MGVGALQAEVHAPAAATRLTAPLRGGGGGHSQCVASLGV